jgi:predicted DNA binding CopG/RHH family protein
MIENRKKLIALRLKESELEEIKKVADKYDLKLSEFIRKAIKYFIVWLKKRKR